MAGACDNAYLIDRAVQKAETFTGIDGINVQDRAIQESIGALCDRSQEHLGPADKGIIQMKRVLREAINTVRAGGTPAGIAPSYYDLYCALQVLPRDADWRQILAPDIAPEKITDGVRVQVSSGWLVGPRVDETDIHLGRLAPHGSLSNRERGELRGDFAPQHPQQKPN